MINFEKEVSVEMNIELSRFRKLIENNEECIQKLRKFKEKGYEISTANNTNGFIQICFGHDLLDHEEVMMSFDLVGEKVSLVYCYRVEGDVNEKFVGDFMKYIEDFLS